MRRIVCNDSDVGNYVASMAGCVFNPRSDSVIGVVDDHREPESRVRGGVIFTAHTGSSCFLHIAGRDERWIIPDMLWAAFHYPFVKLGYAWVFATIEAANEHCLQFNLRTGFRELYRIPMMFPSGDGVLTGMERSECRWLGIRPRTIRAG